MEGRSSRSHLSLLFRHGSQDCNFPFRLYFSVRLELELRAEETLCTPALVTRDMFGWIHVRVLSPIKNAQDAVRVSSSWTCRTQRMRIASR